MEARRLTRESQRAVKQSPDKSNGRSTRRHVSNGVWATDTAVRNYPTHVVAKATLNRDTLSALLLQGFLSPHSDTRRCSLQK